MITLTLEELQEEKLKKICFQKRINIVSFLHQIIWERIEEEEFIQEADKAYQVFLKDPILYTWQDIMKECGEYDVLHD